MKNFQEKMGKPRVNKMYTQPINISGQDILNYKILKAQKELKQECI